MSVLVAEDDADLRDLLALRMRQWGYEVHTAADGVSALETYLRVRPQVLLLDVQMPGMDGLELARVVRADTHRSDEVAIVLLTGRCESSDVVSGLHAGADEYLRKPFNVSELRARLEAIAHRLQANSSLRDLQRRLTPRDPLARTGLSFTAAHQPVPGASAGGDWYCVGDGPNGSVVLVVGDVAGHGHEVAITAAHLRQVSENHARLSDDPATVLEGINAAVVAIGDDAHTGSPTLATAVCVVLDGGRRHLRWASAGHPAPLLLIHGSSRGRLSQPSPVTPVRLPPHPAAASAPRLDVPGRPEGVEVQGAPVGPPLGIDAPISCPVEHVPIEGLTGFLLVSDGLLEARNRHGEQFGDVVLPHLLPLMSPNLHEAGNPVPARGWGDDPLPVLEGVLAGVLAAHREHTSELRPSDDVTVLACAVTAVGPAAAVASGAFVTAQRGAAQKGEMDGVEGNGMEADDVEADDAEVDEVGSVSASAERHAGLVGAGPDSPAVRHLSA